MVERHGITSRAFRIFGWETRAAFQYLLASVLMFLSFVGFGHYTAKLTERFCELPETATGRLLLITGVLMGLPPFFRYVSYPYDPPQLFLFTLALYLSTVQRTRAFFVAFVACCLNKETALLLIPLYGLAIHGHCASPRRYWSTVLGLIAVYVSIKSALTWAFRSNPGSLVEFHLAHNVEWLTSGWTFTDLVVLSGIATLVLFRWSEKPILLRRSFLCVFLPLGALAVFLEHVDEWRGYYEAYPLAFALAVESVLRFDNAVKPGRQGAQQPARGDAEGRAPDL